MTSFLNVLLIAYFSGVSLASFGATQFASGKLVLDKKLEAKAKGLRTLFLVVYDTKSKRPMPYGAEKVMLKADPKGAFYKFNLTSESIKKMMPAPSPKTLRIKARLDKDGSAGMDQPGDITGEVKPVKVGTKNIVIRLSTLK